MQTVEEPTAVQRQRHFFRRPFTPETARIAGLKSAEVKRAQREARLTLTRTPTNDEVNGLVKRLTLLRHAQMRLWRMVVASTDTDAIAVLVGCAREAFDQEQRILGRDKLQRRTEKLPATAPPKPIEPLAVQPSGSEPSGLQTQSPL
jgi:hypothetical protein